MKWFAHLIAPALVFGFSAPAAADQKLVMSFHSSAFEIAGEKFPAANETTTYWFGANVARMDLGERMSAILRGGKLYMLDHGRRTYSEHQMPINDPMEVVGPDMAEIVKQVAVPADAIEDIRPREAPGNYLGYSCRRTEFEISIPLMDHQVDWCDSDKLPIDYNAFRAFLGVRAILLHGGPWMYVIAQKLGGFPLYSEMEQFGFGNRTTVTEELTSISKQPASKDRYEVPAGYSRTRYLELVPES